MSSEIRFFVRTYGCQMNAHDTDKLANLLCHAGHRASADERSADVLVINTCSIRDKAENQLYTDLGRLREWKDERPGRLVGVGGCVAQQVGDRLLARFPHLDFVFGTHNLRLVPSMIEAAREGARRSETSEHRSLDRFDLPALHPDLAQRSPGRSFVTVMEGCDMYCTFCIVPRTRGREISRPARAIVDEVRRLAEQGVREVTLLGQTVNAYGRHDLRRGRAAEAGTLAFAELLAELDAVPGIERIRYTSPHPLFFDDALIAAHGTLRHLCPHVHLPVQSGSNRILEAMRRRYDREHYLGIAAALRRALPDVVLTTDLIVGFPGETERDFEDTLSLVREVGFVDHYSFIYSPRPGTDAAELDGRVDRGEAGRRLTVLQDLQRELTIAYHRSRVGTRTEILIEGESRRGGGQLCGRDPFHRMVNLVSDEEGSEPAPQPGELIAVELVEATPHSLLARPCRLATDPVRADLAPSQVKAGGRPADEGRRAAAALGIAGGLRIPG